MEEQIRTMLLAALPGTPIDWGARPQGSGYPGVVLTIASDQGGHTYDGPDGLSVSRVQVDVYALSYGEARVLSRQIRAALDGYRSGDILGTFRAGERDSRDGGSGEVERPFRISQDFEIHWRVS